MTVERSTANAPNDMNAPKDTNMNTQKGTTRRNSRTYARRDRNNPSRSEHLPIGEWEADVTTKRDGKWNASLRKKVKTRGIKYIKIPGVLGEALRLLRCGYEVRFCDTDGDAGIRLYHCLDNKFEKMFVSARTMGDFRHAINDIGFHVDRGGEELTAETAVKEHDDRYAKISRTLACVTPDLMVKCPQCGFDIRVGKVLANKKEG